MKALKAFMKPFEVKQRRVTTKIYIKFILVKSLGTLVMGKIKFL